MKDIGIKYDKVELPGDHSLNDKCTDCSEEESKTIGYAEDEHGFCLVFLCLKCKNTYYHHITQDRTNWEAFVLKANDPESADTSEPSDSEKIIAAYLRLRGMAEDPRISERAKWAQYWSFFKNYYLYAPNDLRPILDSYMSPSHGEFHLRMGLERGRPDKMQGERTMSQWTEMQSALKDIE